MSFHRKIIVLLQLDCLSVSAVLSETHDLFFKLHISQWADPGPLARDCNKSTVVKMHRCPAGWFSQARFFLGFPGGPSRTARISPMQNMKWFVWKWENYTMIHPLFHNGKTRIKHWNIGPRISLGEISLCFVNSTVIRQRFFHSFPYRECQKSFLWYSTRS
jgi:hypothetical protein